MTNQLNVIMMLENYQQSPLSVSTGHKNKHGLHNTVIAKQTHLSKAKQYGPEQSCRHTRHTHITWQAETHYSKARHLNYLKHCGLQVTDVMIIPKACLTFLVLT